MKYSTELMCEMIELVIAKHDGQMYSESVKYTTHLFDALVVLHKFDWKDQNIKLACLGHDLLEMTDCTYEYLSENFGEQVAKIINLVTDKDGRNRKERHEKTYPALAKNEKAVIVKLADRIANVEAGLSSKDGKVDMYRNEYKYFKDTLFNKDHDEKTLQMWKYLDQLLK